MRIFAIFLFLNFTFLQGANASAPQIKKSGPGYYRFMVGDSEVTVLFDGAFELKPAEVLKDIKPTEIPKLLAEGYQGPSVFTSDDGFLINTGAKLVLIDTGAGSAMGPTNGKLLENLKASGYQPEQVDEIYITHMHGDHIGGLTSNGKMNFPNATLRADRREGDYWLSEELEKKATEPHLKANFANARAIFAPYQSSGKFKPFDGETDLVPGVHSHPAYGHTPGHTVYTVESKDQKLWLLGDMIHVAAVQFPKPTATLRFDYDSKLASAVRAKVFSQAAKASDLICAAHLSFPGVGHIKKAGSGYLFTPLSYKPVE